MKHRTKQRPKPPPERGENTRTIKSYTLPDDAIAAIESLAEHLVVSNSEVVARAVVALLDSLPEQEAQPGEPWRSIIADADKLRARIRSAALASHRTDPVIRE